MTKDRYHLERIEVESYSGYKLHESPSKFVYGGRRYTVREITDRWYEGGIKADAPVVNYFKVRADDGQHYLIRYDSYHDEWTLVR
jgi:hypothetical protein